MPIRVIASFAVAILLGVIAVLMVRGYLGGAHKGPAAVGPTTAVVVAAVPIARGATLQPGMLKTVNYPQGAVPSGAFSAASQLNGEHLALRSIVINEPILADKISGAGARTNLSGTLVPGMRAVSIKSDDVAGVAGFAMPGDRVDVLGTRTIGSGDTALTVTQVLAENVRVLGVDQSDDADASKPVVAKAITIEVTPNEAGAISLSQTAGTVSLALRQISDAAAWDKKAVTTIDLGLFGHKVAAAGSGTGSAPKPAAPVKPAIPPGMTEIHVTRGIDMTGYPVAIR